MPGTTAEHRFLLPASGLWVSCLLATLGLTLFLSLVLETPESASPFLSNASWQRVATGLGGTIDTTAEGLLLAQIPMFPLLIIATCTLPGTWIAGSFLTGRWLRSPFSTLLEQMGHRLWTFWWLPTVWSVLWLGVSVGASVTGMQLLGGLTGLAIAISWGGILGVIAGTVWVGEMDRRVARIALGTAILVYVMTFTAMNWGLWFNLRLPHGDSAMYEEHLWNVLHGKGFRSYLDQGLFLGEHVQVVHLLLIPLYVLWPSQLLLELLGSLILASGAIPVYILAKRHSGSATAACLLGLMYLLYFPMQSLDIAIDLKTFRPNGFGIPLLLWTIDALERRAWKTLTVLSLVTLSCQEDYAIPLGLLGFWQLVTGAFCRGNAADRKADMWAGGVLWVGSMLYLAVVLKVVFPYFREGAEIHYVSYFQKFGNSPVEILKNILFRPGLLLSEIATPGTLVYALQLLVPLAGLPLRSPSRLLTAAPLFVLLCLNELAQQPPSPVHHFHAPIVPLLFWAAAAGSGKRGAATSGPNSTARYWLCCGMGMAVTTTMLFSMSPLGLRFWDPGRSTYWRILYVPDARAQEFSNIAPLIPITARVASTDFVHPRFTHCERSYDYSKYPRRVANYEDRVPNDTDYIVIDFQHPYSEVRALDQVRELQREPEKWELLTDRQNKYFAVLKRRP